MAKVSDTIIIKLEPGSLEAISDLGKRIDALNRLIAGLMKRLDGKCGEVLDCDGNREDHKGS